MIGRGLMRITSLCLVLALVCLAQDSPPVTGRVAAGEKRFQGLCGGCHGPDGAGGERGPSIIESRRSHSRTESELRNLITHGIPVAGMPAFQLPVEQLDQIVAFVRSILVPAAEVPVAGDAVVGARFFAGKGKCLSCHTVDGAGGLSGPDLSDIGARRKLREIREAITAPSARIAPGFQLVTLHLKSGQTIRGFVEERVRL